MKRLLAAFIFFTRLPFGRIMAVPADCFKHVVPYWPIVGWLTGGILAGTLWLLAQVLPLQVAWIGAIVVRLLVTGCLHEDGLADFCDGFGGGTTRERTLAIMKDSHIGTYGVVGLIVYFLLWSQMIVFPLGILCAVAFCADVYSKWCVSHMVNLLPYARKEEESKAKILYADHTVSSTYYPNKKAIGIVFDEKKRKAIGLEYFLNEPSCMGDSIYYEVSDITSCEEEELETCATDGKINTQKIKQSCQASEEYMNMTDDGILKTYVPDGCSAAWCGAGQWYIPSIAELKQIYKNLRNINAALALNGIVGLLNTTCTTCWRYHNYYGWFPVFSSNVYHRQSNDEEYAAYYIYSFNSDGVSRQSSYGINKIVLAIQY